MDITSVSKIAPLPSSTARPKAPSKAPVPASTATRASAVPSQPSAKAPSPQNASSVRLSPASTALANSAANSAAASLVSPVYSVNVSGKSYAANVQQSNGDYKISDPSVPGASVTASSLQGAETAFSTKIDRLV